VRDIGINKDDEAIVSTIIAMAKHLGFEVVAEGVETQPAFDFLRREDCGTFQGYFFSRPVTAEALMELLRNDTDNKSNRSRLTVIGNKNGN